MTPEQWEQVGGLYRVALDLRRCWNSFNTFGCELSHAVYKTFAVRGRLDGK